MKKISVLASILTMNMLTVYSMELTPTPGTNLDTLIEETLDEISYFLDARNIAAIRCVNTACKKKALSQEKLDKNFTLAASKAFQLDDGSLLKPYCRYVYPERIFLNLLKTDSKLIRFMYAECHLDPNNILDTAAKYGDIKGAQLIITDYYANDINRALKTAVLYQCKDFATTLIKNHRANLSCVRKKAAQDGNIHLLNKINEFYPPEPFSLDEELKLAAKNGHLALMKIIIDKQYSLISCSLVSEAASGCFHHQLESCGHKDIIIWLIDKLNISNENNNTLAKEVKNAINYALIKEIIDGHASIVIWIVTQYKKHLCLKSAYSQAKESAYLKGQKNDPQVSFLKKQIAEQ